MKARGMILFAAFAVIATAVAFLSFPPTTSEAMAAWVQAVGAIAAIVWAGKFTSDQLVAQRALQDATAKAAAAQRLSSFIAICEVAIEEVRNAERSQFDAEHLLAYASVFYEPRTFDGLSAALDAFPVHELPTALAVGTAQRFRDGLMHTHKAIAAWVESVRTVSRHRMDADAKAIAEAASYLRSQFAVLEKELAVAHSHAVS